MPLANNKTLDKNPTLDYEVFGFNESGADVNIPLLSIKNLIGKLSSGVTNTFELLETATSDGSFVSNSLSFSGVTNLQFNNKEKSGVNFLDYFQLLQENKNDIFLEIKEIGYETKAFFRITNVVFNNDNTTSFEVVMYGNLNRGSLCLGTEYSLDISIENFQADYNQTDNTIGDFIKNKPTSRPLSFITGLVDALSSKADTATLNSDFLKKNGSSDQLVSGNLELNGSSFKVNGTTDFQEPVYANDGMYANSSSIDMLTTKSQKVSALNASPASANDTGTLGDIKWTRDYVYLCVDTNTWKRSALVAW